MGWRPALRYWQAQEAAREADTYSLSLTWVGGVMAVSIHTGCSILLGYVHINIPLISLSVGKGIFNTPDFSKCRKGIFKHLHSCQFF